MILFRKIIKKALIQNIFWCHQAKKGFLHPPL